MNLRSSTLVRAGVSFLTAVGLAGGTCATSASADATTGSSAPAVHVSATTVRVGQLFQVTGTGWSPVGQTVQIELCGQDALNLSNDCDQADEYSAAIRPGGLFYGALIAHLPPSPCPCVVLVTDQGAFSGVHVPVTVVGAPTAPVPTQGATSDPVVLSAKVRTSVSAGAWFGAPRGVILVLRITNRSTSTFGSPALSVNVGRGRDPSGFVVARPLAPLSAGATQVLRIPVTLPAFTFGGYSVRAQVITGEDQVATVATTSSYPWGLFVLAALLIQTVLLFLRNRARRRLGRRRDVDLPDAVDLPVEVSEPRDPAEPVWVIDLRPPREEPAPDDVPEPAEVLDLRTPSLSPADAWTVDHRLVLPLSERDLTCKLEVLACPEVGLQRTTVLAWDGFAISPWDALHQGTLWTETAPDAPLDSLLEDESLRYDGRGARLALNVTIVGSAVTLGDNCRVVPVRVQGEASFGDDILSVDVETTVEQTWVTDPPADAYPMGSEPSVGSLAYGRTVGGDSFYVRFGADGEPDGWLIQDGRASTIVRAVRRVHEQAGPYPRRLTVELGDALGRRAVASGTAFNGMAFRDQDGLVLECRTEWNLDGVPAIGEDRSLVDLDTWRRKTRAGIHVMEPVENLWQREVIEDVVVE